MKNFWNLFAVYALIFGATFVYTWLLGARQKRLDRKTQRVDVPTNAASVLGHTIGSVNTMPDSTDDDYGATDLFDDGGPGITPMLKANSDAPPSGPLPPSRRH